MKIKEKIIASTLSIALILGVVGASATFNSYGLESNIRDESKYTNTNSLKKESEETGFFKEMLNNFKGNFSNNSIKNSNSDYGNMMNGFYNQVNGDMVDGDYAHGYKNMMNGYNGSNYGSVMNSFNNGNYDCHSSGIMLKDYEESDMLLLEELKEKVNKYIRNYNEKLEIADIFTYSNSEYYFSIVESDTGRGAVELLVNPITGNVIPEYGPNMMWNEKYGMMGSLFSADGKDKLDIADAKKRADKYLAKIDGKLTVEDEAHEFYGYFTFHILNDNVTAGMLSVNSNSGQVWYHDWHGKLIEVISSHDDAGEHID